MTKVSLLYLSLCVAVGTTAFSVMVNVDHNSGDLSSNQAYPAAQDLITSATVTVDNLPQPQPPVTALTANQQAAAAFERGEAARLANHPTAALTFYSEALSISQTEGFQPFETAIWQSVAQTYVQARDYQNAETAYQKAIDRAQSSRESQILGAAQAELAQLYVSQGQLQRALPLYRNALVSLQRSGDRQAVAQVKAQTQQLEVALKPAPKPAKPRTKPTIRPVAIAIAPEPIVMPESAPDRPVSSWTDNLPVNDALRPSDRDPEPPLLMNESVVQPVSNDAM